MRPPPLHRGASAATSIARHGHRFTATILIAAAAVGIGVGVAAPETSPVAPAQTVAVPVPVPVPVDDDTTAVPRREAPENRGAGADGLRRGAQDGGRR